MATLNAGSGADGNATVSANTDISTTSLVGRGNADMVSYQCTSVGSNSCVASATPNGIAAGDEVLLLNWQGTSSNYGNVGNYETFIVDNVSSNTITFTTSKTKYYGDGTSDDTNIGTTSSNQRVLVQRIPQYNNLTVDNGYTLTGPDAWDNFGGVFFIRVAGTATINGSISMTGKGYTGGYNNYSNPNWYYRTGASYTGGPKSVIKGSSNWFTTSYAGGGARGGWNGSLWAAGAGGGYGTAGTDGEDNTATDRTQGGSTYGDAALTKLFLGSGGGAGDEQYQNGTYLSDGGGIIAIFATTLDIYGSILCNGVQGDRSGQFQDGSGAGGSILLHAGNIYTRSSTFTATGGPAKKTNQPASYYGGAGGDGRIAIHYATLGDSLASVDPTPYTDSGLQLPYSIAGTISENCTVRVYDQSWNFIKQEAASGGSYTVSNLPNAGPFHVVALPGTSSKNAKIYRDVVPTQ